MKKKAGITFSTIIIILVVIFILLNIPIFKKTAYAAGSFFNLLGIEKECPSTGKTLSYYYKEIKKFEQVDKLTEEELEELQKLCMELEKCYEKEYYSIEACQSEKLKARDKNE